MVTVYQSANLKKALKVIDESTNIARGDNDKNIEHLTQLLLERKKKMIYNNQLKTNKMQKI